MQTLAYPIRILEQDSKFSILVPHDSLSQWRDTEGKTNRNKTREFCNWIRRQFSHIPTEFRYVNTKQVRIPGSKSWSIRRFKTVKCDKHFIAYNLSKTELMLIKLSWQFSTQPVRLQNDPADPLAFTIDSPGIFGPSNALLARLEKNTKAKPVRV
jgi:hypothetical protein